MVTRKCKQCAKDFSVEWVSGKQKFCSRRCFSDSIIGHKAWNKGLVGWRTKAHEEAIRKGSSRANSGKNHRCWGNKTWWKNPETGKIWTFKGIITATKGYVSIYKPDHPRSDSRGYVYQHRYLMEQKLGRFLDRNEVVHHINHNRHDNRLENLELMTKAQHNSLHHLGVPKRKRITSDK